MSKALIINFENSEEHLYKWLVNHKNYESVIKRLIDKEISINKKTNFDEEVRELNINLKRPTLTKEQLSKISKKVMKSLGNEGKPPLSKKDLDNLSKDDKFRE